GPLGVSRGGGGLLFGGVGWGLRGLGFRRGGRLVGDGEIGRWLGRFLGDFGLPLGGWFLEWWRGWLRGGLFVGHWGGRR
ncbi:MAG: hypothetical protein IT577_23015, partial [Verrucomicrobiae bacterium]|nr:hypothetical protein [Verrucomicrobiae bacterium]